MKMIIYDCAVCIIYIVFHLLVTGKAWGGLLESDFWFSLLFSLRVLFGTFAGVEQKCLLFVFIFYWKYDYERVVSHVILFH